VYDQIRKGEKEFNDEATKQHYGPLAAKGGAVPPIHRHFQDKKIEEHAFLLQKGQISPLIEPENCGGEFLVLKCDERIPPKAVKFEEKRTELYRDLFEQKLTKTIPIHFMALRQQAT